MEHYLLSSESCLYTNEPQVACTPHAHLETQCRSPLLLRAPVALAESAIIICVFQWCMGRILMKAGSFLQRLAHVPMNHR